MRLQSQLSNGRWVDCDNKYDNRTEEFLTRIVDTPQYIDGERTNITREQAVEMLSNGVKLRNDRYDWYSNCRDGEYYDKQLAALEAEKANVATVLCDCGHHVPRGLKMSASLGSSCPDCYDRMSA